jgi:SAM-dependent methyltransferase
MRSLLGRPAVYSVFRRLVGRDSARSVYAREHLRLSPGQRVLDLGCGPGDILQFLPAVDYVGYDINRSYIERARRRFGTRGKFLCATLGPELDVGTQAFDVAIAHGVLHHLDDEAVRALFRLARRALRPGGRLVTFDGCYVEGQPALARLFLSLDRGRHVRGREAYEALARSAFDEVKSFLRHDLIRIPYTHLIMECGTAPRSRT